MTKRNFLILAIALSIIIILAGLTFWTTREQGGLSQINDDSEADFSNYQISDRGEIFSVSGGDDCLYKEVIFDPYIMDGAEEQFLVVTLKEPDKIRLITAKTKDEQGNSTLFLKRSLELEGMASFIAKWKPEEVISSKYYPIEFEYETIDGRTDSMTLQWHTKFD